MVLSEGARGEGDGGVEGKAGGGREFVWEREITRRWVEEGRMA